MAWDLGYAMQGLVVGALFGLALAAAWRDQLTLLGRVACFAASCLLAFAVAGITVAR